MKEFILVDPNDTNQQAAVDANGRLSIEGEITSALPTGDNNIGNVDLASELPAGTQNIGDVDVLTINSVAPQFDDTDKLAVSLYGKDGAVGNDPILSTDGHLATIDTEHYHLHQGGAFLSHVENSVTNIGEMTVIAFNTPATGEIHITSIQAQVSHATDLFMYENTSIDVGEGVDLVPKNRRRQGTPPATALSTIEAVPETGKLTYLDESAANGANITTDTEVDHIPLLGGGGPKALGANAEEDVGYELKSSSQYAIVLNAKTADDATHYLRIAWYEE